MTKETICDNLCMGFTDSCPREDVYQAMDEWANIDSIEFAKWIPQNAYIAEDEYYYCLLKDASIVTEEQLYELYQQSKTK